MAKQVFLMKVNEGKLNERIEVVKPLKAVGNKTQIAYIGSRGVATKWVTSERVYLRN